MVELTEYQEAWAGKIIDNYLKLIHLVTDYHHKKLTKDELIRKITEIIKISPFPIKH